MGEEFLCPRCSAANPKGTAFCGKCGANLVATMANQVQVDPLIGAFVGERFLVKRKLGEGGMGVVYEAEQTAIDRKVALKVLHPHLTDESLYARFRNEAAAASKLGHPNTITVFDFGKTETGSLYIAMEFIEGASLDDEIARSGAIEWRRASRIATQICGSLQNAHEHGIVHRDLKPENVMLLSRSGEKDIVKVLDFGIAKIMEDDGKDQRQALTKTGMVFGTPQYMSPEQIRGDKVDARSDIYSMGVIVYQMLTGTMPFHAETPMGLLTKHLMDPPPPFATANGAVQVPAELERLVMQTLAKNASDRPQTMKELADKLDEALRGSPTGAVSASTAAVPGGAVKTVVMDATPGPSGAPRATAGRVAPSAKKGGSGMVVGMAVAAVVLLGGGGAAAWYFLAGPGSASSGAPVAAPIAAPPAVAPPPAVSPPATVPPATVPVDLAPLAAIPTDPAPGTTGKTSGGSTRPSGGHTSGGKTGTGTPKPKGCMFNAGEDNIGQAVRDALRAKEGDIRKCAQQLAGEAQARFAFSVSANANQVTGVAPKTQTGLEGCLKPNLAVSIASSDSKARTGDMTITMKGRGGLDLCNVQVNTAIKSTSTGKPGAVTGIGGKIAQPPGGTTTGGTKPGGTTTGTGKTGTGGSGKSSGLPSGSKIFGRLGKKKADTD